MNIQSFTIAEQSFLASYSSQLSTLLSRAQSIQTHISSLIKEQTLSPQRYHVLLSQQRQQERKFRLVQQEIDKITQTYKLLTQTKEHLQSAQEILNGLSATQASSPLSNTHIAILPSIEEGVDVDIEEETKWYNSHNQMSDEPPSLVTTATNPLAENTSAHLFHKYRIHYSAADDDRDFERQVEEKQNKLLLSSSSHKSIKKIKKKARDALEQDRDTRSLLSRYHQNFCYTCQGVLTHLVNESKLCCSKCGTAVTLVETTLTTMATPLATAESRLLEEYVKTASNLLAIIKPFQNTKRVDISVQEVDRIKRLYQSQRRFAPTRYLKHSQMVSLLREVEPAITNSGEVACFQLTSHFNGIKLPQMSQDVIDQLLFLFFPFENELNVLKKQYEFPLELSLTKLKCEIKVFHLLRVLQYPQYGQYLRRLHIFNVQPNHLRTIALVLDRMKITYNVV